ncbi:hypothetical protein HYFRA_00002546 [Hymenoscyphus fraxineus]|uniref:Uncharacterized protein n=1 Tax=Hymenoscyphus fraxineus TaxID=746836 RepID=A0A9N9L9J3_9HELO|nr:hypothetical protein HYFRA_00002546 [Hymenoscyphus fraxineus]
MSRPVSQPNLASPLLSDFSGTLSSASPTDQLVHSDSAWRQRLLNITNQRDAAPIPISMNTPPERLIEFRLFHHYVQMTQKGTNYSLGQVASPKNSKNAWSDWILRLAIESPNLMDALLGFAAFHLQHLNASDKEITEAAHRYMMRAIVEHADQVRKGITAENAEVVFATSTFIAFHVASERLTPDEKDGSMMHWFQPWDGIRALLVACWEHIKVDEIRRLIQYEHALEFVPMTDATWVKPAPIFDFLIEDLTPDSVDGETMHAYTTAVYYLNKIVTMPLARHVLKFSGMVSKRFVELVSKKEPRAMCIVGYHLMLVKQLDSVVWLQRSAKRDFAILLEHLPEEWKPKMALAVEGFSGALIFDTTQVLEDDDSSKEHSPFHQREVIGTNSRVSWVGR